MKMPTGLRLHEGPNPGGVWDVALDEAILWATREDHGPLTMRVWQSTSRTLILPRMPLRNESLIIESARRKGFQVTRGLGGHMPLVLGADILSFSFVDESKVLKSGDMEAEEERLLSSLMHGLQSEALIDEFRIEEGHLIVEETVVGSYNTSYYFEYMLLQGMILVRSNSSVSNRLASRHIMPFSSLLRPSQTGVSIAHLQGALKRDVPQHLGLQGFQEDATPREIELMNDLYRWKYTSDMWILHQSAPLALGRVLLEAYLAYPPTSRCREIMAMIDEISKALGKQVECRIWLRGRGLIPWLRGVPPGLRPSGGVMQASKKNIVPAIVIEGNITHERTVPRYDDIRSRIEKIYHEKYGGT